MADRSRGPGRHYRFEHFEFWAEQGLITLIDIEKAADSNAAEREYRFRIAPGEFMKRAISAMITEPDKYPSRLRALRKLLEDAKAACLLAKRQGDPTDPSVLDHVIRHKRKRSALVLPGSSGLPPMPGQRMKIRPRGNTRDILSQGVQVIPDLTIDPSTVMTPERKRMAING